MYEERDTTHVREPTFKFDSVSKVKLTAIILYSFKISRSIFSSSKDQAEGTSEESYGGVFRGGGADGH